MAQPSIAKGIVAPDIGERFLGETWRLRRIDRRHRRSLAVDQPVQDIENESLGGNARLSGQSALSAIRDLVEGRFAVA